MTPKNFEYILNSIKNQTRHIYLHITGEPLLHPDLKELLAISEAYGMNVNIVTNGTLLANVDELLLESKAVRQVNFSVHSLWESGADTDINPYLDALLSFADTAHGHPIVAFRVWTVGGEKQKYATRRILNHYGLADDTPEGKGRYKGIQLADKIFLNGDDEFTWPNSSLIPMLTQNQIDAPRFCYGMRSQCGILVDGTVVPCCLDSEGTINLGNIYELPFEDIITSKRAATIYDGFTNHCAVEPFCQTCGFSRIKRG